MDSTQLYAEIFKVDEDQRLVFGYASTEARDQQGEIVRIDAIRRALPDYMKYGAVREMHQPSAVGTASEADVDHKGLWFGAKVVDDRAWLKVKEKVYKGFSIGGRVTARDPDDRTIITGIDLTEISLVDRPANPQANFELVKRFDGGLRPQPLMKWDCGDAAHQHATKVDASRCMEEAFGKGSEDQPRDDHGRWGSAGGSMKDRAATARIESDNHQKAYDRVSGQATTPGFHRAPETTEAQDLAAHDHNEASRHYGEASEHFSAGKESAGIASAIKGDRHASRAVSGVYNRKASGVKAERIHDTMKSASEEHDMTTKTAADAALEANDALAKLAAEVTVAEPNLLEAARKAHDLAFSHEYAGVHHAAMAGMTEDAARKAKHTAVVTIHGELSAGQRLAMEEVLKVVEVELAKKFREGLPSRDDQIAKGAPVDVTTMEAAVAWMNEHDMVVQHHEENISIAERSATEAKKAGNDARHTEMQTAAEGFATSMKLYKQLVEGYSKLKDAYAPFKPAAAIKVDEPAVAKAGACDKCGKTDGHADDCEMKKAAGCSKCGKVDGHEEKCEMAAKSATVKERNLLKGLSAVATLANLLEQIKWLQQSSAVEQLYEHDTDSEQPKRLEAWLSTGAALLRDVVAEEVQELISGEDAMDAAAPMMMVAKAIETPWTATVATALREIALGKADFGGRAPLKLAADKVEKAGARHSKADLARVQTIHDHACGLGATCANDTEKLAKAAGERDVAIAGLEKVTTTSRTLVAAVAEMKKSNDGIKAENGELKKRIATLEGQPVPPKTGRPLDREKDGAAAPLGGAMGKTMDEIIAMPAGPEKTEAINKVSYLPPSNRRQTA